MFGSSLELHFEYKHLSIIGSSPQHVAQSAAKLTTGLYISIK